MRATRFRVLPEGHSEPMEEPVYPMDELVGFQGAVRRVGGVVTFNAGIYQEGHLGPRTVRLLADLASRFATAR